MRISHYIDMYRKAAIVMRLPGWILQRSPRQAHLRQSGGVFLAFSLALKAKTKVYSLPFSVSPRSNLSSAD
jgi:hypothetical protein